jgi:urease accessory protein
VSLALLVDARFPGGAHAHSGGVEQAVDEGLVHDVPSLSVFLAAATTTVVETGATAAAMCCRHFLSVSRAGEVAGGSDPWWEEIDAEVDARTPSPALRAASRRLGRHLLLAARAVFPHPVLDELSGWRRPGPHQAVATGAVCASAGLEPKEAAYVFAYGATAGMAGAALRLLGLDPIEVTAALAEHGALLGGTVSRAADRAGLPPAELPALATPLYDRYAEYHAQRKDRLFAS